MGATELIFKLRSDGYSIKADGGYLDIYPADDLSPEFVKQLKLGKPEILSALRQEEESRVIAIPATKVAKVARVNPQTDQTAEPDKAEKLHELSLLIEYVAEHNDFSESNIEEAKFHATRDIENALTSFRALARTIRRDKVTELLQASPESPRCGQ